MAISLRVSVGGVGELIFGSGFVRYGGRGCDFVSLNPGSIIPHDEPVRKSAECVDLAENLVVVALEPDFLDYK